MTNYETALLNVCSKNGFFPRSLGTIRGSIGSYPTWLVQTAAPPKTKDYPRVLIVSGFHGEEPAGPLGILRWLELCTPESFMGVNVTFLPVVNLYGFTYNKRYGPSGTPTNAGFYRPGEKASPEGQILKEHIEELREMANDGYLSLHEDSASSEYYIYAFEPTEMPGRFTTEMKHVLSSYFLRGYNGIAYVDTTSPGQGPPCEDGLIWKFYDGSFDDWMYQLGVPRVVVTETPGLAKLPDRIEASIALIDKCIALVAKGV